MHFKNLIPDTYPDKKVIPVKQYVQYDSTTEEGYRMCKSTAHAMFLKKVAPKSLSDSNNADDDYLLRLKHYGDTTNPQAHVKCLRDFFKLDVEFRTDLYLQDVLPFIMKDIPVPVGTVHHGHYTNPVGGGHEMLLVGWDFTEGRKDLVFHDPAGKMDLENGGYSYGSGRYVRYNRDMWIPRWQVNGTLGWGTLYHGRLK